LGILRIQFCSFLQQWHELGLCVETRNSPEIKSTKKAIIGAQMLGSFPTRPFKLSGRELAGYPCGYCFNDLNLDCKQVGQVPVVELRLQMVAGRGLDQLRRDA